MPLAGLEHAETHLPLSPSVGIKGVGYHVPLTVFYCNRHSTQEGLMDPSP